MTTDRRVTEKIEDLRARLASARNIVVLTGAGVSVASGLRPYRGPGGLWTDDPDLAGQATLAAFERDPMAAWRVVGTGRSMTRSAQPNAAHRALSAFEASQPASTDFNLITQNIDGLHQRAGSRNVIELHGALRRTRCSAVDCDLEPYDDDTVPDDILPCPRCGSPLRPDIVLFEELIPAKPDWLSKRAVRDCDFFMAVGTSGTVSPASNFVRGAKYAGAFTLYANLDPCLDRSMSSTKRSWAAQRRFSPSSCASPSSHESDCLQSGRSPPQAGGFDRWPPPGLGRRGEYQFAFRAPGVGGQQRTRSGRAVRIQQLSLVVSTSRLMPSTPAGGSSSSSSNRRSRRLTKSLPDGMVTGSLKRITT